MSFQLDRRGALVAGLSAAASALPLDPSRSAAASDQAERQAENQIEQWWGWRGPRGNNHAAPGTRPPASIDRAAVLWSVDVPGRGHSSPIVAEDSIYLTTADKAAGTQSVLAFSRAGRPRWEKVVHRGGLPEKNHRKNTEASPTAAFDGEAVFAAFYNAGGIQLSKLSPAGELIWQRTVGPYRPQRYQYGYAASPLIEGDRVIINVDYDGDAFLAAVDRRNGETVWKIRRPGKMSFSSPIVGQVAGRRQLLLSGAEMVAAYDPDDGALLWRTPGATTMATCGTMVWEGDRVFASGGYPDAETVCIAADGSGQVLWSNRTKCYEQSMLVKDGYVYAVADNGVAYCWRGADGKTMWRERLGGKYSSSPLLVGETVIVFDEGGRGFVFAATPEAFDLQQEVKLADECFASPVMVGETLYLRVAETAGGRQEKLLALR
jgi:outer membrane protein assembly factor BamB